jgi:L-ascorbate metabolism protein UlaG (beta-lactamase superfamily)
MTAYEAALASQWLGLDYALACHYTNKNCDDVNEFVRLLETANSGVKPVALDAGGTFEYSPGGHAKIYQAN